MLGLCGSSGEEEWVNTTGSAAVETELRLRCIRAGAGGCRDGARFHLTGNMLAYPPCDLLSSDLRNSDHK